MVRSLPSRLSRIALFAGLAVLGVFVGFSMSSVADEHEAKTHQQVIVPEEDRFTPFGLTIRSGSGTLTSASCVRMV